MDKSDLEYLYEEYKLASARIEGYQSKHLSFYNGFTIIGGGLISYLFSNSQKFSSLFPLVPYLILLPLTLIIYHYHRTLVVQGHRKALEEIINKYHKRFNPLQFSRLTTTLIINHKYNWTIIPIQILSALGILGVFYFSHYKSDHELFSNIKQLSVHFFAQTIYLVFLAFLIKRASKSAMHKAYETSMIEIEKPLHNANDLQTT